MTSKKAAPQAPILSPGSSMGEPAVAAALDWARGIVEAERDQPGLMKPELVNAAQVLLALAAK